MPPSASRTVPRPPEPPPPFRIPGSQVVAAFSLFAIVTYVGIAVARMAYPFELEWLEGGLLQAMQRALHGQPLYAPPTLDYVAFNYPPLYPWLAALAARVLGEGFLPLRLISFLASLGCFALIGGLVWREGRNWFAALLAVGIFAATFRLGGAWFDVARADSLYLLLLLGAFAALRLDASRVRSAVLAGALFSLAFLAKQSALMVALPLLAYLLWTDRVRFLVLAGTMGLGIGGSTLWLDHQFGGWYRYFLFYVPSHHGMALENILDYWPKDIVLPLGLALLIAAAYFGLAGRTQDVQIPAALDTPDEDAQASPGATDRTRRPGFYAAMLAGTALSSWYHRMYPGGYENVLMPAHATIALVAGLGWQEAARWLAGLGAQAGRRLGSALAIAAALQFAALVYNPLTQIPGPADRAAGEQLIHQLRAIPGRPLIPSQPYLACRAGKPDHFHEMAFEAVVENGHGEVERRLEEDLEAAVRDTAFSVVVLSSRGWLGPTIRLAYEQRFMALQDPNVFWPVTGTRTRPEFVYLPRSGASAEESGPPSPRRP
jgi:hypothetical protein